MLQGSSKKHHKIFVSLKFLYEFYTNANAKTLILNAESQIKSLALNLSKMNSMINTKCCIFISMNIPEHTYKYVLHTLLRSFGAYCESKCVYIYITVSQLLLYNIEIFAKIHGNRLSTDLYLCVLNTLTHSVI